MFLEPVGINLDALREIVAPRRVRGFLSSVRYTVAGTFLCLFDAAQGGSAYCSPNAYICSDR